MDFPKDDFDGEAKSGTDGAASAGAGENAQLTAAASGEAVSAEDAAGKNAAGAPKHNSLPAPMSGEILGPGSDHAAPAGASAQGSALVRVPPASRGADGVGADFSATRESSSSDFTAGRRPQIGSSRSYREEKREGWARYAIPAVLGFCLFGVGVATGVQFFGAAPGRTAGTDPAQIQAAEADMRHMAAKLRQEIHALETRVEGVRAPARSDSLADLRGVKQRLDALNTNFQSAKAQTEASIAALSARLDRLQHDETRSRPVERTVRTERPGGAPAAAALVARPATPRGTAVAEAVPGAAATRGPAQPYGPSEPKKHLRVLTDWVVRDVYEGVALVEGPEGSLEVTRGEVIPGAGMVETIERRGGGWVVITTRGMVTAATGD